jgi:5-methylcytosine-specific restriction endonuclease McrA
VSYCTEYARAYYQANKERIKARSAQRRLEKPQECRAAVEKWHKDPANVEKRRAYYREVAAKSEAWARAQEAYRGSTKGKATKNSCVRAYHLRKDQRMPAWLNEDQIDQIRCIYRIAAITTKVIGRQFEVDHIVPLSGKRVSGMHVPWNLQILTEKNNVRKGNTFAVS